MKRIYEQLSSLDRYDVVFVCGLYKSGTSLLTTILETKEKPFYNPAQQTNPSGEAIARDGGHYQTRECSRLFRTNKLLIRSAFQQYNALRTIADYLNRYRKPLVLKDPQLLISLPYWLEGALYCNYKPAVAFTCRDEHQIAYSWKEAPFTKHVLHNNSQAIRILLDKQTQQKRFCTKSSTAHQDFYFDDLIEFKRRNCNKAI